MRKNSLLLPALVLLLNANATFAQQKKAVKRPEHPNIIIILADDMGYSDLHCFGSETQTPNLDSLAANGMKFTQFYNASRCCPTRASLLTGLYQHQAGVGDMVNTRKEPAYEGYLNQNCVTIAEALKATGYTTLMAGKWHVGTDPEHWPVKRGFDHYFGLIDGASSYFNPTMPYRPNQKLTIALDDKPYTPGPNWYSTNAYTDFAIKFIDETKNTRKPFFLYMAYTSPHWPLHALPEDIAKYKGKYMKGWDTLRTQRLAREKSLGILSADETLSPRDANVPDWNSLSPQEKDRWDTKMAVYAAMIDRMDQNIGRILKELKAIGQDKNTVIMFLSDNGASSESIKGAGFSPEILAANNKPASDPTSFTAYEYWGANVSNTPFRLFKHWEYEGGTATPFIAYYPGFITPGGVFRNPAHIIDLMPTCLELAHATYPKTYNGHDITPAEGISLVPLLKGNTWQGHNALFFEHEGNRAVRQGDWKLVSQKPKNKWELYNIKTDRSELNDLSAQYPDKVNQMIKLYDEWAARAGVIPFEKLEKRQGEEM